MKMNARVSKLGNGFQILERVDDVLCSFYMSIENEFLVKWREPKWISEEDEIKKRHNKAEEQARHDREQEEQSHARIEEIHEVSEANGDEAGKQREP